MGMHVQEAPAAHPGAPAGREGANPDPAPRGIDLQQATVIFIAQRPRLLGIAYRILGSTSAAEDVVQEVWVRWQRTDRRVVEHPPSLLATATSRLAINILQSARTRHEVAVTPWLEQLVDPAVAPETKAERAEATALALRLLLERLSPAEAAAYVLRKGFDYPYQQIAAVLGLSAANARQLVSRAQAHIDSPRRRPVETAAHRRLVHAFLTAARAGEFTELETLLAVDVERRAA